MSPEWARRMPALARMTVRGSSTRGRRRLRTASAAARTARRAGVRPGGEEQGDDEETGQPSSPTSRHVRSRARRFSRSQVRSAKAKADRRLPPHPPGDSGGRRRSHPAAVLQSGLGGHLPAAVVVRRDVGADRIGGYVAVNGHDLQPGLSGSIDGSGVVLIVDGGENQASAPDSTASATISFWVS